MYMLQSRLEFRMLASTCTYISLPATCLRSVTCSTCKCHRCIHASTFAHVPSSRHKRQYTVKEERRSSNVIIPIKNNKNEKFQCCVAMVAGKGCVPLYILCPNIVHLFEPHHFNQFVSFVTNRGNHVPHTKQFISSLRRQYLIFEKPLALCRQTGRRLYLPQF